MKGTMREKLTYSGAGAGLLLFAVFGLLRGSFLGGVMGLSIAGTLLGYPVDNGIAARMIVAVSMLVGVMVTGLLFTVAGAILGWAAGYIVDAARAAALKDVVKAEQAEKH